MGADLFDFGEDEDAVPAVTNTGAQPTTPSGSQATSPTGTPATTPHKRAGGQPPTSAAKAARKCRSKATQIGARLRRVDAEGPATMQCVFLPAHSQQDRERYNAKKPALAPVVLWPTYVVDENASNGLPANPASTWLLIGHAEAWIADVAALFLPATSCNNARRQVGRELRNLWVPLFQNALKSWRRQHNKEEPDEDNQYTPDDSLEEVIEPVKITLGKKPTADICIEGHTLTMLNLLRPLAIQLDDRATAFVHTAFAPSAASIVRRVLKLPTPQEVPPAPFHFTPDLLRTITGKISWLPQSHAWKLELKKPKKPVEEGDVTYRVKLCEAPSEYMNAKTQAYLDAVAAWNELDGSSRNRIPIPLFAFGAASAGLAAGSQPTAEMVSGSQPTAAIVDVAHCN